MNKRQREVEIVKLAEEKKVLDALKRLYKQAAEDVANKIQLQTNKIEVYLADIDNLSENDKSILQAQIYQRKYQQALKTQLDAIIDNLNKNQYETVNDYLENCYETGYIGTIYDLHGQDIPIITPIDQQSVTQAVTIDSKISQKLYGTYTDELKKKIQSEISRGIATSLTHADIARNLQMQSGISLNKAMRIARTEGHGIQIQAANDAMHKAKDAGADILKQWDATLDGRTRKSHRHVDGEIRELDEKFSNGMMYPSDPVGGAAEVVNCRCALLQRAKWELDEEELETLKERAEYFELDKTENFNDFKKKYINAVSQPQPKKEYLTKKKLQSKIADADVQLEDLDKQFSDITQGWSYDEIIKGYGSLDSAYDGASGDDLLELQKLKDLEQQILPIKEQKAEWEAKLQEKLIVEQKKALAKQQNELETQKAAIQQQLDDFEIKTYSGIWKDDVTTADFPNLSIEGKKKYYEGKFITETDPDLMQKYQDLYKQVQELEVEGKAYADVQQELKKIQTELNKVQADLQKLENGGIINTIDDAFSQARKDAALWFTDKNGSVKAADAAYRDKAGEVWRSATEFEKDSIYDYTGSYHKFNEPLRGIEYMTNVKKGVGNVDLDQIGVGWGFKPGQMHREIDAVTSIIDKSSYDVDLWVQRGCEYQGMDDFLNISMSDLRSLSTAELSAKLVDTTHIEYAFMSTGVAKGKGLNTTGGVTFNIYAPKGTKMMYIEPISEYGNGDGRSWNGISKQQYFGNEAEMLFQRGTKFRITKVERNNGTIYIDMDVIEQVVN